MSSENYIQCYQCGGKTYLNNEMEQSTCAVFPDSDHLTTTQNVYFQSLPQEMQVSVLKHTNLETLLNIRKTSKSLNHVVKSYRLDRIKVDTLQISMGLRRITLTLNIPPATKEIRQKYEHQLEEPRNPLPFLKYYFSKVESVKSIEIVDADDVSNEVGEFLMQMSSKKISTLIFNNCTVKWDYNLTSRVLSKLKLCGLRLIAVSTPNLQITDSLMDGLGFDELDINTVDKVPEISVEGLTELCARRLPTYLDVERTMPLEKLGCFFERTLTNLSHQIIWNFYVDKKDLDRLNMDEFFRNLKCFHGCTIENDGIYGTFSEFAINGSSGEHSYCIRLLVPLF